MTLEKYLTQKIVVITITASIIVTMLFLAWIEDQQRDYSFNKNWWAVSFVDPHPTIKNNDFTIENYAHKSLFHYTVLDDEKKIVEEKITIEKGTSKTIKVPYQESSRIIIKLGTQEKTLHR